MAKNSKIQNGHHFWGGESFKKLPRVQCSDSLSVENFNEITLSCTVKEIEAILCFTIFGKNSKIQNGRHFWGGEKFLKIAKSTLHSTLWVENFDEITLSCMVKEKEANLCFAIFGKNSKIQNGHHFWGGYFFFNCQEYNAQIPFGLKILTKSLYLG